MNDPEKDTEIPKEDDGEVPAARLSAIESEDDNGETNLIDESTENAHNSIPEIKKEDSEEGIQASPNLEETPLLEGLKDDAVKFNSSRADVYYDDELNEMTWGRRLARYWATRYDWYDPSKKKEADIKLDSAWAYFEHSALPRYTPQDLMRAPEGTSDRSSFFRRKNKEDQLVRAEFGERDEKTKLYSFHKTPERELGDFGLGVGIYFWTLRVLAIICLIAGFISIPNMIYFNSSDYDGSGRSSVPFGLELGAICTDTEWVPCPTCEESNWTFPRYKSIRRYATAINDENLVFVLKNNCNITLHEAICAFAAMIFVVVSFIIMSIVSRRREVRLDEYQQTASDYSIEVSNPPENAVDPDEWKIFFSQFEGAQVVAITVALDNEELIRTLVKRRKVLRSIKALLKDGVKFNSDNMDEMISQCVDVPSWKKYLCFASDAKSKYETVKALEAKAEELSKRNKCVNSIFCTFQTEQQQRDVLEKLSTSGYERTCGSNSIQDAFKFRGEHVLSVTEAKEPSAVLWENLDTKTFTLIVQVFAAFVLVFGFIFFGAFLIYLAGNEGSALWTTVTITAINQIVPRLCKFITSFEAHKANGSYEASLYVKMTVFKWINTAIITSLLHPFVATIDSGLETLTKTVKSIFIAELVTNPSLLLLDIWGQIQRHYLGPRANSQEQMNLRFRGAKFSLALRYTELTKILFLTFFYSALYPGGFFFAAASLTINYFVDKFCLLRTYGKFPVMGNAIAQFSRSYLFPAAFAAYAVMLAYNYTGWPYDNLCKTDENISAEYLSVETISISGEPFMEEQVSLSNDDKTYQYCLQDMIYSNDGLKFPPIPSYQDIVWMTNSQEEASKLLGWTSVGILALTGIVFLRKLYVQTIRKFFIDTYRPTGQVCSHKYQKISYFLQVLSFLLQASTERFLDLKDHYGYIPSVEDPAFEFPLLACSITDIDEAFLSWSDPSIEYPYDKHNLIFDIPSLVKDDDQNFSVMKTWTPENAEET